MEIMLRSDAKTQGLIHYFTGKPCKHGHTDRRFVSTFQCVECATLHCKAWQPANRLRLNEWKKVWRKANPDKTREEQRRAYAKNKERFLSKARNRSAKKRDAKGFHTQKDIQNLLRKQKRKCAFCFVKLGPYHVDHMTALANGGSNGPENLQCLCPTCNIKKSDKDPFSWAQENGRLL